VYDGHVTMVALCHLTTVSVKGSTLISQEMKKKRKLTAYHTSIVHSATTSSKNFEEFFFYSFLCYLKSYIYFELWLLYWYVSDKGSTFTWWLEYRCSFI